MTTYVAGWNMPGYLPDMEPACFDTAAEAWEWLRDEAQHCADELRIDAAMVGGYVSGAIELEIIAGPESMPRDGIGSHHIAGLAYWVDAVEAEGN